MEAAFCTGDFAPAHELLHTALEQARGEDDRVAEGAALNLLGITRHYESIARLMRGQEVPEADIEAEERLFRQALELLEAAEDRPGMAEALFGLGLVFQVLRRDWGEAMPLFRRALEIVERLGKKVDEYTRSEIHRHIGFYYLVEEVRPELAIRHLKTSLRLRVLMGDLRTVPSGLEALGEAELAAGHRRNGLELLREAVTQARRAGLLAERIEALEQTLASAAEGGREI